MQKANKFICAGVFMLCMQAHTQTLPISTLNQAIEVMKARKALEVNSTLQALSYTPKLEPTATTNKTTPSKNSLELWAIRGLGHDLSAEVLYQGQIKEVSFASEKLRIGNWLLVGINEKEVEFSALHTNGKLSSRKIRLTLPQPSDLNSMMPNASQEGVYSADSASRPPVPMSLLKP